MFLFTTLFSSLIENGMINSKSDIDRFIEPKFFYQKILLFPESMYYWIEKSELPNKYSHFLRTNKSKIISYFKENFPNDSKFFDIYKYDLQIMLKKIKKDLLEKHRSYSGLIFLREKIPETVKRKIYQQEYLYQKKYYFFFWWSNMFCM